MKTYDPNSLLDIDPGPWKPDPLTFYWATADGLVAIPAWEGPHISFDRWSGEKREGVQRRKAKVPRSGPTPKGYIRLNSELVHRVVARAWVPNPENKPQVNHIDGNKANNRADNLEWMTTAENVQHSYDIGLQPFRQRDKRGRIKNVS